jgi:hypothetical protein
MVSDAERLFCRSDYGGDRIDFLPWMDALRFAVFDIVDGAGIGLADLCRLCNSLFAGNGGKQLDLQSLQMAAKR